eukprot:5925853-Pyramimonas_sp.AAC.1
MTSWEMIHHLREDGWAASVHSGRTHPEPFVLNGKVEKLCWFRHGVDAQCKSYLRVLLSAPRLREVGVE